MRLLYKAALYKKHYKELCLMKIGKFEITKRIKIVAIVALAAVLLIAALLGIGAIVGTEKHHQNSQGDVLFRISRHGRAQYSLNNGKRRFARIS